jgi:hypothetical protein
LLLHIVRDTVTAQRDSSADLAAKHGGHVRDFRDAVPDAPVFEDYFMQSHSINCEFCSEYPGSLFTNLQQSSPYAAINAAKNARMHARCVDWNDLAFVRPTVALRKGGPKTQTIPNTCIKEKTRLAQQNLKTIRQQRRTQSEFRLTPITHVRASDDKCGALCH